MLGFNGLGFPAKTVHRATGFAIESVPGRYLDLSAKNIMGLADGAEIAVWPRGSGTIYDGLQDAATKYPLYRANITKGNLPGVWFDGINDWFSTPQIDLSGTQKVTVYAVVMPDTTSANRFIIRHGAGAGTFYLYHSQDANHINGILGGLQGNVGFAFQYNDSFILNAPEVVTLVIDKSLATAEAKTYVNGMQNGSISSANNTDNFDDGFCRIGCESTTASGFYKGYMFRIVGYTDAHDDVTRQKIEDYLIKEWFYSYKISSGVLFDNAETEGARAGGYYPSSAFARLKLTTTSTRMTIDAGSDINAPLAAFAKFGVYVNDVYTMTASATVNLVSQGCSGSLAIMAGGVKTVDVLSGLVTRPGASNLGTFPKRLLYTDGAVTVIAPPVSPDILVYGDSIAAGADSTNPCVDAWAMIVREAHKVTGGLAVEAWGYRSLYFDAADATTRAAFVAKLAAAYAVPTIFWLAIGTNDYGLNTQNAANFETRYAALLDALHAQFPLAMFYAQTPIERNSEVANGSGNTLGDYRTAIANAQAPRSAWCMLVDGTAAEFPQAPADLVADGIHPTTAGHARYASAVRAILGI